jgi:hypothetical protein
VSFVVIESSASCGTPVLNFAMFVICRFLCVEGNGTFALAPISAKPKSSIAELQKLNIAGVSPAGLRMAVSDVFVKPRSGMARDANRITAEQFVDLVGAVPHTTSPASPAKGATGFR